MKNIFYHFKKLFNMVSIDYVYKSTIILLNYKLKENYYNSKIIIKFIFKLILRKTKVKNKIEVLSFKKLNDWSQDNNANCQYKNVLVDCMWDNANYWFRYSLFRKSLGLNKAKEFAIFSDYSKNLNELLTKSFNFRNIGCLENQSSPSFLEIYKSIILMQDVKTAEKFLQIKLPYDFPISILYDGIIKKQQKATIDLSDLRVSYYLAQCISYLKKTDYLFDKYNFDLVVLSHFQKYNYAALAWIATLKNVPVYTLYGVYGTLSFYYLKNPNDVFNFPNRPYLKEIKKLSNLKKSKLVKEGKDIINDRFKGKFKDIGTQSAYINRSGKINKNEICRIFNWDSKKKIITVYCSSWFDYPHGCGLKEFTDFKDWIDSLLSVAIKNTRTNWLIKTHPSDHFYPSLKGETLEEKIKILNLKHIQLVSKEWNGLELLNSTDALTTCHGTVGLEGTMLQKPVLIPYKGWYGHLGIVKCASDKENYIQLLNTNWFDYKPTETIQKTCAIMLSTYFGKTKWQKSQYEDDSIQERIYEKLDRLLEDKDEFNFKKEIKYIKDWVKSRHPYYQIYKKINY